ncbi:hypothetical protein ACHHYP_15364 [Achlya hypogyna]|uniref:Myb-like domain-containing protein n=1 Tax=Achlya hypogyna TaxID=1202772 RepID=A0A1V9YAX3_ACHHY|nr:hypothetical protein ACHHYP_15364 [Achlya hypogyna]
MSGPGYGRDAYMAFPAKAAAPHTSVYSTATAVWSAQELHLLHKGLTLYPAEEHDNVTRYIKIAATIPGKCIRDVAVKVRGMRTAQEKQPDPAPKRQKLEAVRAGHPQVLSSEIIGCRARARQQFQQLGWGNNVNILNAMRANLMAGDLANNVPLMAQFRDSCHSIFNKLHLVCSAVPPLQVKIDTSLIPPAMHHPSNQDSN